MTGFKDFVSQQVKMAEAQLRSLLCVRPDEDWTATLPALNLDDLKDNPAVSTPGWSFLCDPRNTALQGHSRWLLRQIAETDQLQKEFFTELKLLTRRQSEVAGVERIPGRVRPKYLGSYLYKLDQLPLSHGFHAKAQTSTVS